MFRRSVVAAIAAVACCIILGQVTSAKQPVYVTMIDKSETETIAEIVCETNEGNEYMIAQPATIIKLYNYFQELPLTHKLFDQYTEQIKSKLEELVELIKKGEKRDVCGQESIEALLKFHRKYISRAMQDVLSTAADRLPKVLELFAIHYLYEVSLTCKAGLIEKLDTPEAKELELKMQKEIPNELKELDRLNEKYSVLVGGKSGSLRKFYDIVLLWSTLDRSPMGPDVGHFSKPSYYNNYQRLTVASSEAEKAIRVQQECKALKPLYESPLLAVVRLIDIGYYLNDESFATHLKNRVNLRRLIGLAITCETLAPVGMIQDDTLKQGTTKMMTHSEALSYPKGDIKEVPEPKFNIKIKPRSFKIEPEHIKNVISNSDEVVEKLTANLRDREKFVKRVVRHYMGKWKVQIRSIFSKIFFLSSHKNKRDLYPSDVLPLFEMLS